MENTNTQIDIERGWFMSEANDVAVLYEEAFGAKFTVAISDKTKRMEMLAESFQPDFSYVVRRDDRIIGIAGFQTPEGSLTGGMDADGLIRLLGTLRGLWACLILSLFERKAKPKELVMDGIAVNASYRGFGAGSALLDAIIQHAADKGFDTVRLDVIDSNPRAKKLYVSKGFVATKVEHFAFLKPIIGFSSATTMVFEVKNAHLRTHSLKRHVAKDE
ncbi:GNAT family N-acetyltransferase [Enterovibrio norvegicus]|uniref:GNAT family N-acetyltransferase n=1 Tax=Enterovibrio norvegicus TaxID=188144 RepID=UPI00355199D2